MGRKPMGFKKFLNKEIPKNAKVLVIGPVLDWHLGEHIRAFTTLTLTEILERNGFDVTDIKANLVSFMPTIPTGRPWSELLGKIFPSLGEILITRAIKRNNKFKVRELR
jgi:hypothetical protein